MSAPAPSESQAILLSSFDRNDRFATELAYLSKFCGKTLTTKNEPRKRALIQLVTFANTKAHLADLVNTIAGWREAKRPIDSHISEEIIGRCINLGHPEIALSLLANRPKYGVDLTSMSAAHKLLHELCRRAGGNQQSIESTDIEPQLSVTSSPLNDVLLLAALYPHYRLSEVYEDPISLAMILALCKSLPGEEVRQVEGDLLNIARERQSATAPIKIQLSNREKSWVHEGRPLIPYPVVWS